MQVTVRTLSSLLAYREEAMESKTFTALLLAFLIPIVSSCGSHCPSPTPITPPPRHPTPSPPTCGTCPPGPTPSPPTCGTTCPPGPTPPSGGGGKKCPRDALKFGICADVLNGLLNITLGKPPKEPCCNLIKGLVDLEAALCLCTALKANILGINLNLPISLSLLLNYCGKKTPTGFQCP